MEEIDLNDCLLLVCPRELPLLKLLFLLEAVEGRQSTEFLEAAYFIPPLGPSIFLAGSKLLYGLFTV